MNEKCALIVVFWCYFLFFRFLFSSAFYFGVCWRKSNSNRVSEQSDSLKIIFVLCGTIYKRRKNKFVSQLQLNALNHIVTAMCVCVCACFSSLTSSRWFFFHSVGFRCYYLCGIVGQCLCSCSYSLTIWGNEILTSYVRAKFFKFINVLLHLFAFDISNHIRLVRSNCLTDFTIKSNGFFFRAMQNESNQWK